MNRFTTAAIFLLILAASVFAAGGALKPVTATENGIETRTVTRAYQTDAAPEAATEPPESDSDQEELHTPEQAAAPPYTEETVTMCAKVVWAEKTGETNVGRTLPEDYFFFEGDGAHNHYRTTYEKTGETWDWSYTDPYNA